MSKYSNNIPPDIMAGIGWFFDEIPEGSTLLDVGCSTGYYGKFIRDKKKCKVYGIEVSSDKEEAKDVLDGVYSFDLDQNKWPKELADHKYDVIFLGDVIEHVKDPCHVLKKINPLLAEGGKIYISTPNIAHISVRLELLAGNFEYEKMGILDSTHLKYFTKRSLAELIDSAGYSIERIDSSESDFPREIVAELLEQQGLKATPLFWKKMSSPEARTVQYKLVVTPKKMSTMQQHNIPEQPIKPMQYKTNFINNLHEQISLYKKTVENQQVYLEDLRHRIDALAAIYGEIDRLKVFKVFSKHPKFRDLHNKAKKLIK
jgi:methionine biosynthesis protein MetW